MNRIIKDYANIQKHHMDLIGAHYPMGFDVEDLIKVTLNGEEVKCLKLETEDTTYLFKLDLKMIDLLDDHLDAEFDISDIEDHFNDEY